MLLVMPVGSYISPKAKVRASPIHRGGLFADEPIRKGEIVAIKGGHVMDYETLKEVEDEIEESYIQIEEDFFIGSVKKSEVMGNKLFLNHSCDPNLGIRGQITFIAIRDISSGEELTYDWAMESIGTTESLTLRCNCGSENCRKLITGDDWKRKDLQKKYGNYFSSYILTKIRQDRS